MTAMTRPRLRMLASVLLLLASATGAAASTLNGRVIDPDRRPVANAEVIVSGSMPAPVRTHTGADGSFAIDLPDGRYSVVASTQGLASDAVSVQLPGSPSVDVTLRVSALAETMVVTAAQIDQPLSRTPDSVTVIPGAVIEARQQFTIAAALRSVPGLTVQQSGGPGSVTSLFTRGGQSNYTLVMIDGVRANAFGGGLDLSQVPLDNVDRIEVVRGPQSALYGSDAIGGVIHIITRSGGTPSARAQVETGSRDMRRISGDTTGELKGLRWQLGANHWQDNGFTGTAPNGQTVSNDDFKESQLNAALGWRDRASGADVQGTVNYVDTDRGSPGPFGSDPARRYTGVNRVSRGLSTRVGGGARWVQPWFGAASRIRQRVEFDTADYDLNFKSATSTSNNNTRRSHARVQTDVAASATAGLSAGVEWLGEKGGSTFITTGTDATKTPVERSVFGFFGEGRWNAAERATLTAGIRGERITRAALAGDPLAFTPRPAFPEETIVSINPKIAGTVLIAGSPVARAWTRGRAAFGTGIRPPDAFEIAFTDNSGLKPERSASGEAGVVQMLAGGAVQIDATAFVNRYTDMIISVGRTFSGVSRWRTDNISNARARGAELGVAWRVNALVDVRGHYTFVDSEIRAVNGTSLAQTPYKVGDALLRRPRHSASIDATVTHRHISAFTQLQARGQALDAEPAFGPTGGLYMNPGHTIVNIGAALRAAKAVEIFARASNLFDRRYEEVLGYPAPGRTAYVGARVAVGR